jgi:hypothetical protein
MGAVSISMRKHSTFITLDATIPLCSLENTMQYS